MIKFIEIILLIILFILNLLIEDLLIYYLIVYLCLLAYTIYKIYLVIRVWDEKLHIKDILKLILAYIFSYFLICDPNPFYYFLTFYLPFQNFFRMIFVIIIVTYYINKLSSRNMEEYLFNFISNRDNLNELNIVDNTIDIKEEDKKDNEDNKAIIENTADDKHDVNISKQESKCFLSGLLTLFKRKRNILFFILCLSLIQYILFLYRIKFWIHFTPKEKALPIATAQNTKFYITAAIYNMEPKIVDYIQELKKLIEYLGTDKVMVSIIENGDSTDNTREYLYEFQRYLNESKIINEIGMKHEINYEQFKGYAVFSRINFLSKLRNRAFKLMYNTKKFDYQNTKIIYINDIIFSYEDIINLLSTNKEDYDSVCAMDFNIDFYDTWASADLSGNSFRRFYPYFINSEGQDQVINLKPIRVFSCWGGVSVFPAAPLENQKLQFRTENYTKEQKYTLNAYQISHIESECTYINIDLQSLGYTKRLMNPDVKVAYVYKYYYITKYLGELYHFAMYFCLYFSKFTEKRNKNMSNLKDKFVKLAERLEIWYKYHKLNNTEIAEG